MSITGRLSRFLDENGVTYQPIAHEAAATAQEVAAKTHVPGREFAKAVVVRADGETILAVLAAPTVIDIAKLQVALGAHDVKLVGEPDFAGLFPECEVGAMPPFGNLYGLRTIVDRALADDDEIAFQAGSHTDVIRMPFREFARLVMPEIADFGRR